MIVSLSAWCNGSKEKMIKVAREAIGVTGSNVRERTPRDTEELALSWEENIPYSQLQAGQTYVFSTNSPYARYIEYLGDIPRRPGVTTYHPRGPYSMLSTSTAEWQKNVREAARGS